MFTQQDLEKLKDENFCLKFELEAIANLVIRNEAERWIPGFLWNNFEVEHHSRYDLASTFVENKLVLDIACGSGYGAYILASKGHAKKVYAYDLDSKSIHYGNTRYEHPSVIRSVANAEEFKTDFQFDVAVSFETIEHLSDNNNFLKNIFDYLKQGGLLIISTPIVQKTRTVCENPYHKIEWSFGDFKTLIGERFTIESTYIQSATFNQRKKTLLTRIFQRIRSELSSGEKQERKINPLPELFINQYDTSKMNGGYQILICRKK